MKLINPCQGWPRKNEKRHTLSISGMKKKRLTIDPLDITKIIKGYYEQFYANKIKILD